MKKFSSSVILNFIAVFFNVFVCIGANPTIVLTPISPTTICSTGNDTLLYSVKSSNIPANTNVVIYQSTDSTFNPSLGQGDSIGFVKGDTSASSIITSTCPKIIGIFIDACNQPPLKEQDNEYMVITSGKGFKVSNLQVDLPANPSINIPIGTCPFVTPSATMMSILRTGTCTNTTLIAAGQADSIPPNAIVIIFTGFGTIYPYNFSSYCSLGQPIYILQNSCVQPNGSFVNNDAAGTSCGITGSTRYRTTTITNRNCFDALTYDRCGLNEFDGANPNANDGNYVIRLQNTDTSTVANGGIQNNAADKCNGVVIDSIIKIQTLKFAIPTAFCNTGMHYIKAILNPQTNPNTISNTIQFQYICNDVRATSNTTNICSGEHAIVNISSTNPNATFSWTTSGGTSITGAIAGTGNSINQTLNYTGSGTKDSITYNIISNDNGCNKSTSVKVVVKKCDTICNASVSIDGETTLCNNSSTTLTATGTFDSVRWNNGVTSSTLEVNQAGTYSVFAFKGNCSDTASIVVTNTVLSNPIILGEPSVCTFTYTILSVENPNQYDSIKWNTGETNDSLRVVQSGFYNVIVYKNGCSASTTIQVGEISLTFQLDKNTAEVCDGDSARFILYESDVLSIPVDTFYFTQPGRYQVFHQSTSPSCGFFVDSVFVTECPPCSATLSVTGIPVVCPNHATTLTAVGDFDSVRWSSGENTASITTFIAGTLIVTVYKDGCSKSQFVNIDFQILQPTITGDNVVCGGTFVTLSTQTDYDSVRWNTGANTTTIQASQQGIYSVVVYKNGCSETATFEVARISIDYFLHKKLDTICAGDTAKFILFAGDINPSAVDTFTFTQPGRYQITFNTPSCGLFVDSVVVVGNTIANPTITGNLSICSGQSTTLDAGIGYDSYAWQPNNEISQAISVSLGGTYTVTVKKGYCVASNSVVVTSTNLLLPFNLGNDTALCAGFSKVLSTGNATTVWSNGDVGAQITVSTPGKYYATITNACGFVSDTIVINQSPKPIVKLGNDTAFCDDELILSVDNSQDIRSILWSTGEQTSSISITSIGTYSVVLTNTNGCSDSDAINITSNCSNEIWLPNAFTPDGNGVNDVFYVRGNPQNTIIEKFVIYNRWGNKIFEVNNILPDDITKGWNGYYKDKIEQLEVYGYVVIAKFANGEKRTLKGNVTLLK